MTEEEKRNLAKAVEEFIPALAREVDAFMQRRIDERFGVNHPAILDPIAMTDTALSLAKTYIEAFPLHKAAVIWSEFSKSVTAALAAKALGELQLNPESPKPANKPTPELDESLTIKIPGTVH